MQVKTSLAAVGGKTPPSYSKRYQGLLLDVEDHASSN